MIAVETRSVDVSIPADPANTDSEAKVYIMLSVIYSMIVHVSVITGDFTGWSSVVS